MLPATTWDDSDWDGASARGWSVTARLATKQKHLRDAVTAAHRRETQRARDADRGIVQMMTAASMDQVFADSALIRRPTSSSVIALLYAMPDSDAIRSLDWRGEYLDVRSGSTWDLFFAGYYRSSQQYLEDQAGARPIGQRWVSNWYFNAREFDLMRDFVERSSGGRWLYSGGTDLVLVNAIIPQTGPVTIDWDSVQSGQVTDAADGTSTLTLSPVVERITRDLKSGLEDKSYGVGEVTDPASKRDDSTAKKVMIGAMAGIVAALTKGVAGI